MWTLSRARPHIQHLVLSDGLFLPSYPEPGEDSLPVPWGRLSIGHSFTRSSLDHSFTDHRLSSLGKRQKKFRAQAIC